MSQEPEELDENDELGQIEAVEMIQNEVEPDPYVEDKDYDPANDEVNPEEREHEWQSQL